ncbi:MAG TPA: hypothetical protein VGC41_10915 [Kofleriaceae bacterium]
MIVLLGGSAAADPRSCVRRFETAKATLIAGGFHPTADGDTAKWLVVDGDATEATMGLVMGGADSAHIAYSVSVEKSSSKKARSSDWRLRKRALCCDDNHEASDHIVRFTWEKTSARGVVAQIVLDRFGDDLKTTQHEADLFIAEARRAAEDCLH